MATATGVSLAIGILVDAGMLPGIVDAEGGKRRIRAWMTRVLLKTIKAP